MSAIMRGHQPMARRASLYSSLHLVSHDECNYTYIDFVDLLYACRRTHFCVTGGSQMKGRPTPPVNMIDDALSPIATTPMRAAHAQLDQPCPPTDRGPPLLVLPLLRHRALALLLQHAHLGLRSATQRSAAQHSA